MISAYNSLSLGESSGWGNEVVKQVIKGSELDYIRNLKYVVNLDLSNNFLSGSIPAEISSLSRLIGLNLSFNDFFGEIPKMIGDMKSLESIDLSHNHLSFWYYSKDYTGNQYLCGAPLPKHCPGDGPHHVHDIEGYKKEDRENDKLDRVADKIYVAVILKVVILKEMMKRK
nr:leucine-rich repeat receptor-like serine/threonine-protein kinase BAM3 [Arachis hypogaea]